MYRLVYKIERDFICHDNWIKWFCLTYPHRYFKKKYSKDNHLGILTGKTYTQYKRLWFYKVRNDFCTIGKYI